MPGARSLISIPALFAGVLLLSTACAQGADQSSAAADGKAGQSQIGGSGPDAAAGDSVKMMTDSIVSFADRSRVMGDSTAKVALIIVSDFQCPFCRRFHVESWPRIKKDYVDKGLVLVGYVNLATVGHEHARLAAEYAMCAGLQRRFWDYHDVLFSTYDTWEPMSTGDAARFFARKVDEMKLDKGQMEMCLSSGVLRPLLLTDARRAEESGARQTPVFFINGKQIIGLQTFDVFKAQIDKALAASRESGTAGTKGSSGGR